MRSYSREFRMDAVRRIAAGEKVPALARELGVHRKLLYEWKRQVAAGGEENLRMRGRPRKAAVEASVNVPLQVAQLERTVAHQQLIIEFFRHALQRVEETRQETATIGATASSSPSRQ